GEPGTQLTLRTFHVGGTASNIAVDANIKAKFDGVIEYDELRTVDSTDEEGNRIKVVMGRSGEIKILDPKKERVLISNHVPYGAVLKVSDGDKVSKGDEICFWDPYNAVIVAE